MGDQSKFKCSRDNFSSVVGSLERFIAWPITNERDRAGVIHAFEYSFELSWKTLQKYAHDNGIQVNGPKLVLREALKFGLIDIQDEEAWFQMLDDRNLTSHAYKEELAQEISQRICSHHTQLLKKLLERLVGLG
ncbi:MAG: HI0074 family nucleotidyltransferase substrate-binding subunit [Proteobacteria bacterium]|nr:HI0074 family nucleotidyltransferase substrate-binding subunit [Pseudomonadota bacterium]